MSDTTAARLLSGPPTSAGAEEHDAHVARLGERPQGGEDTFELLRRTRLRGRGGAAFPALRKWRAVAGAGRPATVLVNAVEAEPMSQKDRLLMQVRPHLVLDGTFIAAEAIGARRIVIGMGREHKSAVDALAAALRVRTDRPCAVDVVKVPSGYVAGEEAALVNYVDRRVAKPTSGPRPYQAGIAGSPTLVQNVETLAHVALLARHGTDWFAAVGAGTAGTTLITLSGGGLHTPRVLEIAHGTTVQESAAAAGADPDSPAVLLGGHSGRWSALDPRAPLSLDPATLQAGGLALGAGVVHLLAPGGCAVEQTTRMLEYMAKQSARQCGPCRFGLPAIADAAQRVAHGRADSHDLARIGRWSAMVRGRGACHHPDGAANLAESSLAVFAADWRSHNSGAGCIAGALRVA